MIYAYVIHTCLDVALATKLEDYKNVFMIYAHVIHTCLDVALATKLKNYKKCIHDICLCNPCMFKCCTNGRGSVPSVISKEHPLTGAAYS